MEKYKKLIYCVILLVVFGCSTYVLKSYFKPIFTIVFLLYLCTPINNLLNKQKIFRAKVNAIISILIVNLLLIIILFLTGNFIVNSISSFMNNGYINMTTGMLEVIEKISILKNIDVRTLTDKIKLGYYSIINTKLLTKGAIYTTNGILTYLIGNMAAYFILVDKYVILNAIEKLITKESMSIIKFRIKDINKMLKIELWLILFTTIETIFGFLALGIRNAFPLGILCGILDIIPYIGTFIVFIPLILYEVYLEQYIIVIGLVLLYFLLFINRQILEAKFMSDKLQVHPLPIMLSLYIGMKVFGFIGLIMGPIYVIIAKEIILS